LNTNDKKDNITNPRKRNAWERAYDFMVRSLPYFQDKEKRKNLPEPNGIYKCFIKKELFSASEGYFMLTDTHLSFFVNKIESWFDNFISGLNKKKKKIPYIPYSQYAFLSTQIKDITSICANYKKVVNKSACLRGGICLLLGIVLPLIFKEFAKTLIIIISIILAARGGYLIIGAFSFLRSKTYKINIGTVSGGITIMGASSEIGIHSSAIWNNPMTVVYNAEPLEYELINFIEKINHRITLLQERGTMAFEDCIEDKEVYFDE
jgi:hypothetical protein